MHNTKHMVTPTRGADSIPQNPVEEDIETQALMLGQRDAEAAGTQTGATEEPPPADRGKPVGSGAKVQTRKLSPEVLAAKIKNFVHGNIYDFDSIKRQVHIDQYLRDRNVEIHPGNRFAAAWRGGENTTSCSFEGDTWCDHGDGDKGGSVLDLCMKVEGLATVKEAATVLGDRYHLAPKSSGGASSKWREIAQYDYRDANGKPLYCKVRYEYEKNGKREKVTPYYRLNADGTRGAKGKGEQPHVLYRLPEIIKAVREDAQIFIVEGEKDVDNLHALGLTATSSKEWKKNGARFAEHFRGTSHVLIIADHDDERKGAGQKIAVAVRDALSKVGVSSSIAYVESGKDATDWIETMRKDGLSEDAIRQRVLDLADNPPEWTWTPSTSLATKEDELPPRFGELSRDSANEEYPTFIGKARMPDGNYYPFEVTAANISMFASIQKAQKEVVGAYMSNHANEKGFTVKVSDLREVIPLCVTMWLRSLGCFYLNAETRRIEDLRYFNRRSGRLLLMASDEFAAWVSNGARINRADKDFLRLMAFLQDAGMDTTVSEETIPKAFVYRQGDTTYISNGESNIVRCKDGKCELVRNGTDGVLFPCEYTLKEWRLLPDEEPASDPFVTTAQFRDLAYSTWYGRYLLRAWYLNLFAEHKNKTPLLLTGERNSGKSATARAICEMAGFPKREAGIDPKKEEDFWVEVNGKGLLFFDNVEDEVVSAKWLTTAIEKVTTGGGKEVRKLYTQTSITYEPTSDLVFASKIPHYTANEGVAHRFVIVNLDANISTFRGDELRKEILDRRDESMTWTARTIAKALCTHVDTPPNVNERYPDFSDFSLRCAVVLDEYERTLRALQCGEFEKSRIVLTSDFVANELYQFLLDHDGKWEGEMKEIAECVYADTATENNEDSDEFLRKKAMRYASALKRYHRPFEVCFKSVQTRMSAGRRKYTFGGLNELLTVKL